MVGIDVVRAFGAPRKVVGADDALVPCEASVVAKGSVCQNSAF